MISKIITIPFIVLLITAQSIFSQTSDDSFIKTLLNNEDVISFIDKDELQRSQRLGISYSGVKNKFLISYDIDENIKLEIKNNNIAYNVNEKKLEDNYSIIEFTVPSKNYIKNFHFKDGKFISPSTYFTRNWSTKESKYFIFKISEPKYFNDYCVKKLDEFVESTCALLQIDENRRQQLEKEKIYYIMCRDDKEIEQVTGYNARGIFITAYDEVISTYNTHFHELSHLLINYKLQNLSLNTLPFFLEGFAVAFGGRGGISKDVVLDIGYFLQKSGFLSYDSLITFDEFYKEDASLTYAIAALYNLFLIKYAGIEKYIELYISVNGSLDEIKIISKQKLNLPHKDEFEKFLKEYEESWKIKFDVPEEKENDYYRFSLDAPYFYTPDNISEIPVEFVSKKYNDVFKKDADEICKFKYGIAADSLSISVYNFYTNDIIASYSINFSVDRKPVPVKNGKYEFYIRKDVFDGEIK